MATGDYLARHRSKHLSGREDPVASVMRSAARREACTADVAGDDEVPSRTVPASPLVDARASTTATARAHASPGELTEAARRPLVRVLTELLLSHQPLRRVWSCDLRGVTFMNSAGWPCWSSCSAWPRRAGVERGPGRPAGSGRPAAAAQRAVAPLPDVDAPEGPPDRRLTGPRCRRRARRAGAPPSLTGCRPATPTATDPTPTPRRRAPRRSAAAGGRSG